jgi:hypothetical protein
MSTLKVGDYTVIMHRNRQKFWLGKVVGARDTDPLTVCIRGWTGQWFEEPARSESGLAESEYPISEDLVLAIRAAEALGASRDTVLEMLRDLP